MLSRGATDEDGKEPDTQWFRILRARLGEPRDDWAHDLRDLCVNYSPAVLAFLRRTGRSREESHALTFGFIMHLAEGNFLRYVRREHERFRIFLLEALKHVLGEPWFLSLGAECHWRDRALCGEEKELFQPKVLDVAENLDDLSPEDVFHRRWGFIVLRRAFERLEQSGKESCTRELFGALKPHLTAGLNLDSGEFRKRFSLSDTSLHLAIRRLRSLYGSFVRAEVRDTVRCTAQIEAEIRDLARKGQILCRPATYA